MANYHASARTNYFRVTDLDELHKTLEPFPDIHVVVSQTRPGTVALLENAGDGWPTFYFDEEQDEDVEVDLPLLIAPLLAENSIAIFLEVGAEKLRYVHGHAVAINREGVKVTISLNDIHALAQETFGDQAEIREALY